VGGKDVWDSSALPLPGLGPTLRGMAHPTTILVTGATGTVGRPLALQLARNPELHVRALVRDPERARELAEAGIELRTGSFEDAASLAAAIAEVDTVVLLTAANPRASEQAHAMIEAARTAKVRRIVRLSAIKASIDGPTENTRQHGRTEAELAASGIPFVAVRPAAYLQNLLWSLHGVLAEGRLFHGIGDARIALIDTRDVTDALARLAVDDGFDGQRLELTGPRSLGYDEIAAALAEALARPVQAIAVTPEAMGEAMRGFGADPWMAKLGQDYETAYRAGWGDFTTDAVQTLTGHPARTLASFVGEVVVPASKAAASGA
jgi:uncharacterized protein YbjT (DUF2867 family)